MFEEAPGFNLGQVVVLYEDEDVAIMVKPQGITTFPNKEGKQNKNTVSKQDETKLPEANVQTKKKYQNKWHPNLKTVLFYLLTPSKKVDAVR